MDIGTVILALTPALINTVSKFIRHEQQQDSLKQLLDAQQSVTQLQQDKQNDFARLIQESQGRLQLPENEHTFNWLLQQDQQEFAMDLESVRQSFNLLNIGLEWLKGYQSQNESQNFQLRLAEENFKRSIELSNLNHQNALKFEEFKHKWETLRENNRQEFEMRLFEERKQLDIAFKIYERNTQVLISFINLNLQVQLEEYKRILADNPLKLQPTTIYKDYDSYRDGSNVLPPLIITSPPALKDERNQQYINLHMAKVEGEVNDCLRTFFTQKYSLNSNRPVKFLGGESWTSKELRNERAAVPLYFLFSSIPTLILESLIDAGKIKVYMSWWDIQSSPVYAIKVLEIPLTNVFNSSTTPDFNLSDDEIKLINILGFVKCLVGTLVLDWYYLKNYNLSPNLPNLLPDLLERISEKEVKIKLLELVESFYEEIFNKLLKINRSDWIPELFLDLASGLASFEDTSFAKRQVQRSMQKWLDIRGILPDNKSQDFNVIIEKFNFKFHENYANKLYNCLVKINDPRAEKLRQKLDNWYMKQLCKENFWSV